MKQYTQLATWKDFARKEYFEPEISRALLVTVALVVPLCVAHYMNKPFVGVYVAITSQLITSAKISGSYLQRAVIIIAGTLAVAVAAFLGTLAGGYLWTAIIFMGIVAFFASLARGIGDYGIVLGISAVILFLISLRAPNTIEAALDRSSLIVLGGTWSALLLLFLWPVHPFLPLYQRIAKPWQIGSSIMKLTIQEGAQQSANENAFEAGIRQVETSLRQAINQVIPLLKKRRVTARWGREDIYKVVGASSRFGATALGLMNELPKIYNSEVYSFLIPSIKNTTEAIRVAAQSVSDAILFQRHKMYLRAEENSKLAIHAFSELKDASKKLALEDVHAHIGLLSIVQLFESTISYLQEAIKLVKGIQDKKKQGSLLYRFDVDLNLKKRWHTIRLALQPNSTLMKHSLRVMIVAAASITISYLFDIPRGYWIVLTVMVLLQPDFGTTKERTKNRLVGTLLGVTIGSLLLIHPLPFAFLVPVIATCCFLFVYLQPKNYRLSVVFITIMLVAMFEISEPVDWHIALYRLVSTIIGGVLAISAAYILWPSWESMQFPISMAKALRNNKNYLLQIEHELQHNTRFHSRLIADRRKAEVENINVLESIKRLSQEPDRKQKKLKYAQRMAQHNSRLTRELTAFAAFLPAVNTGEKINVDLPEVHTLIQQLSMTLDELILAIEHDKLIKATIDLHTFLTSMDYKIREMQRKSQFEVPNTYIAESTLLQEEILYVHVEKITTEVIAMISPLQDEHAMVASTK